MQYRYRPLGRIVRRWIGTRWKLVPINYRFWGKLKVDITAYRMLRAQGVPAVRAIEEARHNALSAQIAARLMQRGQRGYAVNEALEIYQNRRFIVLSLGLGFCPRAGWKRAYRSARSESFSIGWEE